MWPKPSTSRHNSSQAFCSATQVSGSLLSLSTKMSKCSICPVASSDS